MTPSGINNRAETSRAPGRLKTAKATGRWLSGDPLGRLRTDGHDHPASLAEPFHIESKFQMSELALKPAAQEADVLIKVPWASNTSNRCPSPRGSSADWADEA